MYVLAVGVEVLALAIPGADYTQWPPQGDAGA